MGGKRTLGLAGVVLVTVALAGCAGNSEQRPSESPSPTPSGVSVPDLSTFTPAPNGTELDDESGGGTVNPKPAPAWDDAQRSSAITAAEKALTAFARPDLASSDWWAALSPLLTPQAQQDYQAVDPANIPAHKLIGHGAIVDETSTYAVAVAIPTDAGSYTIVLTRRDGASPWLASRFIPPAGTH